MGKRKVGGAALAAIFIVVSGVSGCGILGNNDSSATPTPSPPSPTTAEPVPPQYTEVLADVAMQCGEREMRGEVFYDRFEVLIDGEPYTLPNVISADGAKFSDGHLTLWNRGDDWMEVNEETDTTVDCVVS